MSLYVKYQPVILGGGSGTGVTAIGTIDSQTAAANGAVIVGAQLFMQSATTLVPGLVNNTTQSFSGAKTFTGITTVSNSTASTSATTGALIVTGGVGVSGRLNVGDNRMQINGSDSGALFSLDASGNQAVLVGTTQIGVYAQLKANSAATSSVAGFRADIGTQAGSFTAPGVQGVLVNAITKGAGSTITRAIGYRHVGNQTVGDNNATFADNLTFTGNWAFNVASLLPNSFAGATTLLSTLTLNDADAGNNSGAAITNVQKTINQLLDDRTSIDVMDYGAIGNGIADDFAAIVLAEAAAFAAGLPLYFPPGNYAYAGAAALTVRVSCFGIKGESTLTRLAPTASRNYTFTPAADGIIIDSLTFNAANIVRGININSFHDVTLTNCEFLNGRGEAVAVFSSNRILVERCHISGVIYDAALNVASGIAFSGVSNGIAINNHIEDFRCCGIVTESDGGTKSTMPQIIGNIIHNAHDCDDSSTEYNAGIWVENTNGSIVKNNYIYDIGGNTGQTSLRVIGCTIGQGDTVPSVHDWTDNYIDVCTGVTPISGVPGIGLTGSTSASAFLARNYIKNVFRGISLNTGFKDVTIEDTVIDVLQITAATSAAVLIDNGSSKCENLTIRNMKVINQAGTASTDYGHITFYSSNAGASKQFVLENCTDLIMQAQTTGTGAAFISNSELQWGNDSGYRAVIGTRVYMSNVQWTYATDGRTNGKIVDFLGATQVDMVNCRFVNGNYIVAGSGAGQLRWQNCQFTNFYMRSQVSTTVDFRFKACEMDTFNATYGFLTLNENAFTTVRLFVTDCDFVDTSDNTPLKQGANAPTSVSIVNSTKSSAITAIHNFTVAGVLYTNTTGTITVPNATDTLVGKATSDVLTNKTLSGNTAASLISGSGTLTLNTSGTVTLPNATDTLVGKATSDVFTNKTFNVDSTGNVLSNVANANIKAAAAIAVNKLAALTISRAVVSDGSGFITQATTTATEIGFVNGVTSAIQTQMDLKAPLASPTFTGTLAAAIANFSGKVSANDTTDSTSTSTGSLVTAGGLGVAKAITGGSLVQIGTSSGTSIYSAQLALVTATSVPAFTIAGYGSSQLFNQIIGYAARGTEGSPTTVQTDDFGVFIGMKGCVTGSGFISGSKAAIGLAAEGVWTASSTPTYITLYTCKTATTTRSERARINGTGSLEMVQTAGDAEAATLVLNEKNTTPANPTQDTQVKVYMKSDKFVIQFNNGGTTRYATYDLTQSATAVWATSTSAP